MRVASSNERLGEWIDEAIEEKATREEKEETQLNRKDLQPQVFRGVGIGNA